MISQETLPEKKLLNVVYMKACIRTVHSIVFNLSNKVKQLEFYDGT